MTDDDLDRSLRSWADATDPATDPIDGSGVRADAADTDLGIALSPARRRTRTLVPWALAAAALLVVVAAAAIRLDDDPPADVTAGVGAGVPTQVILDAAPGEAGASTFARVELDDATGNPVVDGPVLPGRSLILDEPLPPGPAVLRYEVFEVNPTNRGMTESDGTPAGGDTTPPAGTCEVTLDVGPEPTRLLVGATGSTDDTLRCVAAPDTPPPTLTIPPAWSLREPLPWSCGTPQSPQLGVASSVEDWEVAWACFTETSGSGTGVELPAAEVGPTDQVRRVWWRVVPGARRPVQVIRSPFRSSADGDDRWTIQRCTSVPEEIAPGADVALDECDEPEPLSLDLPPLPDAAPVEPPDDDGTGVRTQVIVESDLGDELGQTVERVEIVDSAGEEVLSAPVWVGTSLVLDRRLPPGATSLRYEVLACGPSSCPTEADGRLVEIDPAPPASSCEVTFDVGSSPTRVVVEALPGSGGEASCSVRSTGEAPSLTVPPAWSLREPFPWTCGTDAWDRGTLVGPQDPVAADEAWDCLLDAAESARPVELPTSEIGPADDSRRVWWRVEGSGDRPVHVIRGPWAGRGGPWTIQRCEHVIQEQTPLGEEDAGCQGADGLSLALPPLEPDEGPAPEAGSDGASDVVPLRLVVSAVDAPVMIEGVLNRWVLAVDGSEVASGPARFPVEGRGDQRGAALAETTLVAEIEVASGSEVELTWEMFGCEASCPSVGPDGAPKGASAEPFDECRADPLQATSEDPVVVFALDGGGPPDVDRTCSAEATDEVPDLTVPPAWSLREAFDPLCGDDWAASMPADPLYEGAPSPSRDARLCLLRRFHDGARAEMASAERLGDGSTRRLIFRIQPTVVELIRPSDVGTDQPWTRSVCTGLAELAESPWIEATGCGTEEEMSLTPP